MSTAIPGARVVVAVDLLSSPGQRIVAVDDVGGLHLAALRMSSAEVLASEQSFAREGALRLAQMVLAGHEHAMTAPHTLRTIAAALAAEHAIAGEGA
ncbi:hypothetical protein [Antarcticirhabdus aurantiaca]|uniref:Uncharacterized protein n=1 Tax=Antarcticirhabdus aurantiaca TaxID=2606717 RepID=A0ACD4NJH3_9HYPH|nr:hypothetical protein OXU80_18700 [Jeongeuplla avenae]